MKHPLLAAAAVTLVACSDASAPYSTTDTDGVDSADDGETLDTEADAADVADGSGAAATSCTETAGGALPDDVEWIVLDGRSTTVFSLATDPLTTPYETDFGSYDLNREPMLGANGFALEVPARVVGAEVRFANLPAEQAPIEIVAWPDFGSDGYVFDPRSPLGRYTRCLDATSDGQWVRYRFDEPIVLDQPGLVFVGYERGELGPNDDHGAELMMEDHQQADEPFFSGIRWPRVDVEQFWEGQVSPWYTWQVRLAVVREPRVTAEQARFARVEGIELGARVAWADFDDDGWWDVMGPGPRLWRNNGGVLTEVSSEALPLGLPGTSGGLWGDLNNDGCVDYIGQGGVEVVFRNNCDGTFTDLTASASLDDTTDVRDCNEDGLPEPSPTEGVGLLDFDGDGLLDVYLANYECSGGTEAYRNYPDRLFRNTGDFVFTDVSDAFEVDPDLHAGRGVTPADFDQDGDVDLYVSNYRLDPNFLLENRRGVLREVARDRGAQGRQTGDAYAHTIGSVFGDIDGDGDLDLVNGNLAHPFYFQFSEPTAVLINDGFGVFADEAAARGIVYRETHSNPVLFDADQDGDLDLFMTAVYASRDSDYYQNDGTGHFTLQNHESGLVVRNGWGAAVADVDRDGDDDVAATGLFENRSPPGEALEVRAWSTEHNRDALGATVTLRGDGRTLVRAISGGSGTSSQDAPVARFGLGGVGQIDRVEVIFGSGQTVVATDVPRSGRLWVFSDGTTATGWTRPER